MRHRRTFVLGAVVALLLLGFAGTAQADSGSGKGRAAVVDIQDRCDPDSFIEAVGDPDACLRGGGTTFDEFFAEFLDKGSVGHWRFHPDDLTIRAGQTVKAVNRGGEFHTFTNVDKTGFGPGCVELLNQPGDIKPEDNPNCADEVFGPSAVPFGEHLYVAGLTRGTHKFQCLIHPWMHTVVTVR